MKKILLLVPFALFSFLPVSASTWANLVETFPVISVTGNATIEVVPDQMAWNIRVSVEGNEPLKLKSKNDHSSNAVIEILERHNIRKEKIQTSGLSFQKLRRKDASTYYSCSNHIRFVLEDLKAYPQLMEAFIETPYLFISSTGFLYSKHKTALEETRQKALIDAQEKAIQMLAVYKMELGNPIRISDQSSPQHFPKTRHYAADSSIARLESSYSPLREGSLTISSTVSVQFEINSPEYNDPRE